MSETIDKQNTDRNGNKSYSHIFKESVEIDDKIVFKVFIHVDNYSFQSYAYISYWRNGDWAEVHRLFGQPIHEKFHCDMSKTEKHLVTVAKKVIWGKSI